MIKEDSTFFQMLSSMWWTLFNQFNRYSCHFWSLYKS